MADPQWVSTTDQAPAPAPATTAAPIAGAQPQQWASTADHSATPKSSFGAFMDQLGDFWHEANPYKIAKDFVTGAGDTVRALYTDPDTGRVVLPTIGPNLGTDSPAAKLLMGQTQHNEQALENAKDAWKRGDYVAAAAHGMSYLMPFGSTVNDQQNQIEQGNYGKAMGQAVNFGVQMAAADSPYTKAAVSKIKENVQLPSVLKKTTNQKTLDAAQYARDNNLPTSAALETDNKFVAGAQALADHTPLGSIVDQRERTAQAEGLTRVAGELADRAHPTAVAPTQAGTDITGQIAQNVAEHNTEANQQYSILRELEADPANLRNVQTGTKQVPAIDPKTGQTIPGQFTTEPVMEDVPLPVDMRPVKAALKPVYDSIARQLPITQMRASSGIKALENIINGPDAAPVSQVDMDLGTIKAAARGADLPELKTLSQGLAARAVQDLHDAVTEAVSRAERTPAAGASSPTGATEAPAAGGTNANPTGAPAVSVPEGTAAAGANTGPTEQGAAATEPNSATPRVQSAKTTVTVPGSNTAYDAEYQVVDRSLIDASHNGQTFQPNQNYDFQNERNYQNPVNQRKVIEWSQPGVFDPAYHITDNPDATNGPPIAVKKAVLDADGKPVIDPKTGQPMYRYKVLGGNGRNQILDRVYAQDPKGGMGYVDMLADRAAHFGADPADVRAIDQPELLRVVDEKDLQTPKQIQDAITDFNKKGTAALTPAEQALSDSRRVSPETWEHIAGELGKLGPDGTLAQILEGTGGRDLMHKLITDGVVSPQDGAALMDENALTKAGKERVSQLMLGRFFENPEQLDNIPAAARAKLERAAAPLVQAEGVRVGKDDYSLTPHVQGAIDLLERMRKAGFTTVDDYLNQSSLTARQNYSPEAIELAKQLKTANPVELTDRVRAYAKHADYAASQEGYEAGGMFGNMEPTKTPREAFNDAFGVKLEERQAPPAAAPAPSKVPAKAADFDASFKPTEAPKKQTAPPLGAQVGIPAGQEALDALAAGRAATKAKYESADVLRSLPNKGAEGRQVFDSALWAKDAGIERLKQIQQQAPEQMPRLARAYLEDLFGKATAEGGFGRAKSLWQNWQNLGPQTKEMLFPNPMHRADLDNFFLYAKKAAETPNPSGSGLITSIGGQLAYTFFHPVTGVPMMIAGGALAKMLHSPAAIDALTQGLKVSLRDKAAAAVAANRILRFAGAAAQPAPQTTTAAAARPAA